MASLSLFVCAPSGQNSDGTCASGQGTWQNVVLQEPFDPSSLNGGELGLAFSAGFVSMGVGLLIAWAGRQVMRAIRTSL